MLVTLRSMLLAFFAGLLTGSVAAAEGLPTAVTDADYHMVNPAQAKLGQLLFYDKILGGNRHLACATCPHHSHAVADGLSLGIGDGGHGIGPKRVFGPFCLTRSA